MFFEGAWYACEPREPDDKNFKHIFPGLKKNTSELDKVYRKKHPLLPNCYVQDQYEKGAAELRKYYKDIQKDDAMDVQKDREGGMGYIVGPNKRLQAGRYGELPFNWDKLLSYLKIDKITKGRQITYPFLRHGVATGPDSIFHCLERAFNSSYASAPVEDKRKMVMTVRTKIGTASILKGRQELYDVDVPVIRAILADPARYVDPRKFVGVAESYYKCNIFLYVVDSENVNGNIVIPNHSQAYLLRKIDRKLPSVLIMMHETGTEDYPYQCEIMCYLDVQNSKVKDVTFSFINDPISMTAIRLLQDSNTVYTVSAEGYSKYVPVDS
jgi:hypothetical protein